MRAKNGNLRTLFAFYESEQIMSKILRTMAMLISLVVMLTGCIIENDDHLKVFYDALPEATKLVSVDISSMDIPESVEQVYKDNKGEGYSIMLAFNGYYSTNNRIVVGVSDDYIISGVITVTYSDSVPLTEGYEGNFVGKDLQGVESMDLIAGVTITSRAYRNAVADAIRTAEILSK